MAVKPKLALIPSGYKAGKVYSVLPVDGVGDFDFTRSGEATRINKDGLIETVSSNVPRLNYPLIDGVVSGCPSLLLENSSTNLFQYSEDFSNPYWSKTSDGSGVSPIVTSSYAISPDGTQNATRVQFDAVGSTDSDRSGLVRNFAFTNGQKYSISCWVKSTDGTNQIVQFRIAGVQVSEEFIAKSKWKLFTATFTATATTTDNFGMQIRGINSVNESDILIYGMQLELSNHPTSYIPTSGSTATRSAETCNNAGDVNTFNDSEGVLMAEISALADDGTYRQLGITNFPSNNYQVNISLEANSNKLAGVILSNNVYYVLDYEVQDTKTKNKVALKYKVNDLAFYVNGFKVSTINTAPISTGLNVLKFSAGNNVVPFYGNTKQLQYFDTALTDTDLEQLTSWTSFNEMAESQQYTIL